MPPKSDYVQRLLQAEERRNKAISDARANKANQAKKAKVDAEKAVADFKAEKERDLATFKASLDSGAAGERQVLVAEADQEIDKVKKLAAERLNGVADLITKLITTVNTA